MSTKDLIYPNFRHSIVNLAATLAEFLGQETKHAVLPELAKKLAAGYQNVVYLVIDGMGSRILPKHLPEKSFLRRHQIDELTSVFPSTTAAATTSLISALTPAEHGWFAWSMDFDGTVIELFPNRNYYTGELTADRDFAHHKLPYRNLWDYHKTDREIYSCFPRKISSKIHAQHEVEFRSLGEMCRQLDQICREPNPKFVYGYYADFDSTMHSFGINAAKSRRMLKAINRKMEKLARKHPDTLFVITADHGQTTVQGYTYICDDPAIQECLEHPLSLDPRGACFKIKPGMDAQFRAAFQKYAADFKLFPSQELIEKGVFGDFSTHPAYQKYLGDYIAVGTETAKMLIFQHGDEFHRHKHLYHGNHTGMTADEMYVPLIVVGDQNPKARG